MTTKSQDRLLGLTLVALLSAFVGDLLGVTVLVAIGVSSFLLAVTGLFTLMAISLVVGVSRTSGPDMSDAFLTDRTRLSTRPGER